MIVTIDGPAGAGKSTVTRKLAQEIGFQANCRKSDFSV